MARRPTTSQADLARLTGAKSPSVSNWFGGRTKTLSVEHAHKLAEFFGCDPQWLSIGAGSPKWSDAPPAPPAPPTGPSLHDALERVGVALARAMPADDRAELADVMAMWARYEGKDKYRQSVEELLAEPQAGDQAEPGKRLASR